jgi:transcriptional antiterminator RfaH
LPIGKLRRNRRRSETLDFSDLWELGPSKAVISVYMTMSSIVSSLGDDPMWFCLRAEPKREHLAATALRRRFAIECLSPRLRFRKLTRRGPIWFVEAMFPGYVFAKFAYSSLYRAVESSHGVRGILRFGKRLAVVPENTVMALQAKSGADEIVTVDSSLKIGQPVQFIEGPFEGLEVVITQVLPARERIRVLLEFLGRSMEMEVPAGKVFPA